MNLEKDLANLGVQTKELGVSKEDYNKKQATTSTTKQMFDPTPYRDAEQKIDYHAWAMDLYGIDESVFQDQACKQLTIDHLLVRPNLYDRVDIMKYIPLAKIATALNTLPIPLKETDSPLLRFLGWLCVTTILCDFRFGTTGIDIINELMALKKNETLKQCKRRCEHLLYIFRRLPTSDFLHRNSEQTSPTRNSLSKTVHDICYAYQTYNNAQWNLENELENGINAAILQE